MSGEKEKYEKRGKRKKCGEKCGKVHSCVKLGLPVLFFLKGTHLFSRLWGISFYLYVYIWLLFLFLCIHMCFVFFFTHVCSLSLVALWCFLFSPLAQKRFLFCGVVLLSLYVYIWVYSFYVCR